MMKHKHLLVFLAPLLLFAAGCDKADSPPSEPKLMTQPLTIATRPLCVGRFLIDVPVDAKVVWTLTDTHAAGEISPPVLASTHSSFELQMKTTEAELRAQTHFGEGSRFKEVTSTDPNTRLFVYRGDPVDTTGFKIDGYVLKGETIFHVGGFANNDLLPRAKNRVSSGLQNIFPRDTWSIPTEPGFCFDNGFLPGRENSFEATGVQLSFEAYPGVSIFMETRTRSFSAAKEAGLIERTDWAMTLMDASDKPIVLRRRQDRPVLSGLAEEVLWKHKRDGYYQLKGDAEMNGQAGDPGKPDTAFSIILDQPDDGSLQPNEEKVIQLWDAVINSVRLRPGAL